MNTSRTVPEILYEERLKILLAMSMIDLTSSPLRKDNLETYKTLVEIYNTLQ